MNIKNAIQRVTTVVSFTLVIAFLIPATSHGHFIWVYPHDGKIKVVFGEELYPDQAQFLNGLGNMKVRSLKGSDKTLLEMSRMSDGDEGWFEVPQATAGDVVDVECLYGLFGRGDTKMLLDYGAKYIKYSPSLNLVPSNQMNLDVIPQYENGKLKLQAFFKGKPVSGVEFTIRRSPGDDVVQITPENGTIVTEPDSRFIIRAKHTVAQSGEHEGEPYNEQRFYCTLVLDVPTAAKVSLESDSAGALAAETEHLSVTRVTPELPDLPLGLTSFGGTVWDDQIYVVGGKEGKAHSYAKSYQNRTLFQLDTRSPQPTWTELSQCMGLQGLALLAHGQKLYRIGGLEARNAEGEDHDLHSTDRFSAFDLKTKQWTDLPNLPDGRSSFDACIAGDTIYVVGGWTMLGEEDSTWCQESLSFDLSNPNAQWKSFQTPFTVRALAVRAFDNKLYAMGGIGQRGPTDTVHVYDLATEKWREGPSIPAAGSMKAFGCSSVVADNHLLVSTYDGEIYQLNNDMKSWAKIHELGTGRFFHQMLPLTGARFVMVGGAHMEVGKIFETETFQVTENGPDDPTNSNVPKQARQNEKRRSRNE